MKRLGLIDDAFLRLESRNMPLHVGVLMLLEPPAKGSKNFAASIARRLQQSTQAAPPFNLKLAQRRGMHYWEEDEDFDLGQHFAHVSLPQPGRVRELLAMVSRVHSAHLDREYPLWRMYLIEGLQDGRIAVYMKIHHALVDGMAGMKLLLKSMANSAAASKKLPPPWEVQTRKSTSQPLPVPSPAASSIPALYTLTREGLQSIAPVIRELRNTRSDARDDNPDLAVFGEAPLTLFNQKISSSRRFAAQSYSTARMKAVAATCDATLNDVVIAMCAGALRRYLVARDELPEKSLTAAVPVSIRRGDSDAANEVAFTLTTLATDLADPVERLRAIKSSMDYSKERLRKLSPGQVLAYTAAVMIPGQVNSLLGRLKDSTLSNVLISHVPGPRQNMYWQGAKLTGLYPASVNVSGGALNITVVSRRDAVDFGLIACRKAVPHMQRLLDYLELELEELERLTKKPTQGKRASRKAPVKPAAKRKKKSRAG